MEFVQDTPEVQDEAGFLELLAGDLQPFYEPRLPYHNWDEHIQDGMKAIDRICEAAARKGKPINRFMAQVAFMGHDAGFAQDLIDPEIWKPYGSKEGYSAHIMGTLLKGYGFDEAFINGVKTCIMFTKMGETLPEGIDEELANTAKAVRTADLINVFGSFRGFILNSFKLREEDEMYGRGRTLADFKEVTKFVLGNYANVEFLPLDMCQLSVFEGNIEQLMRATPKHLARVLGKQATRFTQLLNKDAA